MSKAQAAESAEVRALELHKNRAGEIALDIDTLASISSWDDAARLFVDAGHELATAMDLGDGFALIGKDQLVGVPFIALQWRTVNGDFGEFVAVHVVTKNPITVDGQDKSKFVFVDGSTGVREQLGYMSDRLSRNGGLVCGRGLRASEYPYCDSCNGAVADGHEAETGHKVTKGTTYYIDTSA